MEITYNQELYRHRQSELDPDYDSDPIYHEISQTIAALNRAYAGLDEALDQDLIDSYIYEINALNLRYHFLLKQSKK